MTRKITRRISSRKRLQMQVLERHSRRCIICHHPEREAIEEEFVHWRAPWKIADEYKVADSRTIYRHARATGILFERRESLHSGLDAIVENAEDVTVTGDCILRAMRAYSCIDRRGRWTELPTHLNIATFQAARSTHSATTVIDIENADEGADSDDDPDGDAYSNAIEPKYPQKASRGEPTACAAPSAQGSGDYSNVASRRDATARAATSPQAFDELEEDTEGEDPDDDPNDTPAGDSPNRAKPNRKELNHSNRSSHSEPTACAASPAQPAAASQRGGAIHRSRLRPRLKKSRQRNSTASAATSAEPFAAAKRRDRICRSRLQPRRKINRRRKSTACAASSAQGSGDCFNVASRSDATARAASPLRSSAVASKNQNNSTGRFATATAGAASQLAAAPKRRGAIHKSSLRPQPKKASRRKSTASDSYWRQTLDELTRMLATAKAEAQRSAATVASAESKVSESPSCSDDIARAGLPRGTKDSPARASDVSESAFTSQDTVAPAPLPATAFFTAPSAQAFPVQLRHPGPYGMSTGNAASSPQPEPPNIYTRANLIGSSAIRNFDKGQGDTNLQNSNRRRNGG